MNLLDFLNEFVDDLQDFQLVSGRTGEVLSAVDYRADSCGEDLSVYDECPVLGIAPDKVNNKDEYYIRIMIDTKGRYR